MSKGLKITLIVLASVTIIIGLFLLYWFLLDSYPEFYKKAKQEFTIEGLEDGFTPQGITYDKDNNVFLTAGYMKDSSKASRFYFVDGATNLTRKYFTLKNGDKDFKEHAGGIATDGKSVWVCGEKEVVEFPFSDVLSVKNGESINIRKVVKLQHASSYCFVEGDFLWVGEFENGKKYPIPESHHIKTKDGKMNKSLAFCYKIDATLEGKFDANSPVKILSTPSLVQGMAIQGNKVTISTSYSLPKSHLYTYNNVFEGESKTFKFAEKDVPLYVLEKSNLTSDFILPAMSEEVVIANDRLYIIFENACKKYRFATREKLKDVYSIALSDLK